MAESIHADTLNALDAMQRSVSYSLRWPTLQRAEQIIVQQEAELRTLRERLAALERLESQPPAGRKAGSE